MPNTNTANLGLIKPEVGADASAWGGHLNTDLDMLDGIFTSASTTPVSMVIKSTSKFVDATTTSKAILFSMSAINTTTPRTISWPDTDLTVAAVASTVQIIATNSFAGVTTTVFTGISSTVNNIKLMFEASIGTTGAGIYMQTYGADGAIDTGVSDYLSLTEVIASNTTAPSIAAATQTSFVALAGAVLSGSGGMSADLSAANIQAASHTKFLLRTYYANTTGVAVLIEGVGIRTEADRITGVLIGVSTGVMTGKATLLSSG